MNIRYLWILAIVLLCSNSVAFAQTLQVIYKVNYKGSKLSDSISTEQMILGIDPVRQRSYYFSFNKKLNDSIATEINKLGNVPQAQSLHSAITFPAFNHIIEKDFQKSEFTIAEEIMTDIYQTTFDFPNSWQLVRESKKFQNYECQKAKIKFAGREWIAWYTPEIAFPDGPYKFHGLPGLILQIYDTAGDFEFAAVDIRNIPLNTNDYKAIKIQKKQFKILKEKIKADPALSLRKGAVGGKNAFTAAVSFGGMSSRKPEDTYARINEEYWQWMKKYDNPIEVGDIWLK